MKWQPGPNMIRSTASITINHNVDDEKSVDNAENKRDGDERTWGMCWFFAWVR